MWIINNILASLFTSKICINIVIFLKKRACNYSQCISADGKVKKNSVGVPTFVIIALRSSFTLCQCALVPPILATYLDTLDSYYFQPSLAIVQL